MAISRVAASLLPGMKTLADASETGYIADKFVTLLSQRLLMDMPMPIPQDDQLLKTLNRTLKRRLGDHLKTVILFGSRARGDHEPDSDYDLLIVVDAIDPAILDSLDRIAGDFLLEKGVLFSLIPINEVSYKAGVCHPFLMNVAAEGVKL